MVRIILVNKRRIAEVAELKVSDFLQTQRNDEMDTEIFNALNVPEKIISKCGEEWEDYFDQDSNQNDDEFSDLEGFFEEQQETGETVCEKLAGIVNRALRGENDSGDMEKLKTLKEKYKRPHNLQNLQVPKVDEILWRNLRKDVKSVDYLHQRTITNTNFGLIPVLRAIQALNDKDASKAQKFLMDAVKISCLTVKTTNAIRANNIKKEILPKYKTACNNPPSTEHLFGDNLTEEFKKMDSGKLNATVSQQPFLGMKGAAYSSYNQQNQRMKFKVTPNRSQYQQGKRINLGRPNRFPQARKQQQQQQQQHRK
ncbi:uncharacterized protein LOC128549548 [Mercenaria mercenaria]|uniref:uncharacterized protein LOC128549548 n=1 Tax=Mercenaria mercenaria TaxID=6596 RepID=UPI00234E9DE9|nr:uncharacterized protein LOC128549548 [Mercenaria mercenaria]